MTIIERKRLKALSRTFLQYYSTSQCGISFVDYLKGLIWIFAITSMSIKSENKVGYRTTHDLDLRYPLETYWLSTIFPSIHRSYRTFIDTLPDNIIDEYQHSISMFLRTLPNSDGVLSWFYQYLKIDKEKQAFNKSLKLHQKISGSDILPTTQFFTEQYMVNFIVRKTLVTLNPETTDLENIRVIDPACGGANFLLSAFDYLLGKYIDKGKRSISEIVRCLIEKTLIGYDLDSTLSSVGKMNLVIKASEYITPDCLATPKIFGGLPGDQLGFLRKNQVNSDKITMYDPEYNREFNFSEVVGASPFRYIITNPPFMGIRDMATDLKEYLQLTYPLSKGDLCVSFMIKCLNMLREQERLGLVNQTSWMYLKTYTGFRRNIIENIFIEECVDLGNKSFFDLSGEKSNVALTILEKSKPQRNSKFYYLRSIPIETKESQLENDRMAPDIAVSQNRFKNNKNYELHYMIADGFGKVIKELPKYGDYSNPMQGTSTGNNLEFIDYAWNRLHEPDWILASKGGGYCKWKGLNIYKVKWGENAEYIRNNPGSALRNLGKISSAQLVYSDTGTLGMNVRVRLENQIFIASGPGIQVLAGDPYAHLAYLNSRVASFFMKMLTPKLTISAGYISNLPVTEAILYSKELSNLAKKCVRLKDSVLSSKIGNEEYYHENYQGIQNLSEYLETKILLDLKNELERLIAEAEIESQILNEVRFDQNQVSLIRRIVGACAGSYQGASIGVTPQEIDKRLSASLNINCQYSSSFPRKSGVGCEGFLEYISIDHRTSPIDIFNTISNSVRDLQLTKRKYLQDFLHKIALYVMGFENNSSRKQLSLRLPEIASQMNAMVDDLNGQVMPILNMTLTDWLKSSFYKHHQTSFKGSPILVITECKSGTDQIVEVK